MTVRWSNLLEPRNGLLALATMWTVATAAFLIGGVVDLHDGDTWNKRSRYEAGSRWYKIVEADNPKGFKSVVMLRYVLPTTIFGTGALVCFVGALAQPRRSRP